MRISALIVNWNTREELEACLASLREGMGHGGGGMTAETGDPSLVPRPSFLEIVVVDNASADGSAAMVRERFPGVTLLAPDRNLGYAAGNNLAAESATGDWLLFLNPDTVVPPGAPEALARFLEERPKAGLAAPRLVGPDGSVQASVRGMPEPAGLFGAWLHLDRLAPGHPAWDSYRMLSMDYGRTQRVPQPMASAWMVRRAAWEEVGPFDEAFPLFFNDVDWCLRAERAGWEIWYDADVSVVHKGGASTRQVKPKATWESHRALLRFYRKHYARRLGPLGLAASAAAILSLGALRAAWYLARGKG